eukprot:403367084
MCNHTQKIQRSLIYISVNLQRAIMIFRGDIFELVVYLVVRCVSMCEESISEDSGRISDSQNVIENRTHQIYSQKRSEIYNEKRFDLDPKSQIFAFSMCNHTQKIQRSLIYISVNLQRAIMIFRGDIFELVVCGHDFSVTQMK